MAKAGDKVKITTSEGEFEGTLLPRPELLSDDITVLKLTTGYNIGIESKSIKKVQVVKKHEAKKASKPKLKKRKDLPTVAILSTGGTISSRVDYQTGGVFADYTAEDFVAMCPELQDIANIEAKNVLSVMSEDANSSDWLKIAKAVKDVLPKVDGVVITHGTDTMHYTSAALSFLLKDVNKPVVLTGAQRSIDRGSSDAFMNLTCAVLAAAKWDGADVVVCMHGSMSDDYCNVIRGTKVRKMHATRRDAFRPINDEPLARVHPDGTIESMNHHARRSDGKVSLRNLDPAAALVWVYPDMEPSIIDVHVKNKVKSIILAGTGLGHVPLNTKKGLGKSIQAAIKKGVNVFMTPQTLYGRVHPYVYANLRTLSKGFGVVYLQDILPETAYVKAMVAAKEKNLVKFMTDNIAGEFTSREIDDSFLR